MLIICGNLTRMIGGYHRKEISNGLLRSGVIVLAGRCSGATVWWVLLRLDWLRLSFFILFSLHWCFCISCRGVLARCWSCWRANLRTILVGWDVKWFGDMFFWGTLWWLSERAGRTICVDSDNVSSCLWRLYFLWFVVRVSWVICWVVLRWFWGSWFISFAFFCFCPEVSSVRLGSVYWIRIIAVCTF